MAWARVRAALRRGLEPRSGRETLARRQRNLWRTGLLVLVFIANRIGAGARTDDVDVRETLRRFRENPWRTFDWCVLERCKRSVAALENSISVLRSLVFTVNIVTVREVYDAI